MRTYISSYERVHVLLRELRGPARDYDCLCGEPATEWAYQHTGSPELRDENGGAPHSADPDDYEPMCGSCHKRLDIEKDPVRQARLAERSALGIAALSQRRAGDPEFASREREVCRRNGEAMAERFQTDLEYAARMSEVRRNNCLQRRRCAECEKEGNPGVIGRHQKATGHTGYVGV